MEYTWLGIGAALVLIFSCLVGYRRGFVKEVISVGLTILSFALIWVANPYMNRFLTEYTPVYEKIQEKCEELVDRKSQGMEDAGIEAQEQLIDSLPIPETLRIQMSKNNNDSSYQLLDVDGFKEYVSNGLANMLVNGIGFFLSFLLCNLVIRLITYILDIIAGLPVIRQVNKLAGMAVGGAKGLILIWIAMLVITIFCSTAWGEEGMALIHRDSILRVLYDVNPLVGIFMNMF